MLSLSQFINKHWIDINSLYLSILTSFFLLGEYIKFRIVNAKLEIKVSNQQEQNHGFVNKSLITIQIEDFVKKIYKFIVFFRNILCYWGLYFLLYLNCISSSL